MGDFRSEGEYASIASQWLEEGCIPKMVSTKDGGIVMANRATEELLGFSESELLRMTWYDLTPDKRELANDQDMVDKLVAGKRVDYNLIKFYRTNGKPPVRVQIYVRRWPIDGDVKYFMVTIMPIVNGQLLAYEQAASEFVDMSANIRKLTEIIEGYTADSELISIQKLFLKWSNKNPKLAMTLAVVILIALTGKPGFDFAMKIGEAMGLVRTIQVHQNVDPSAQ